MKKLKTAHRCIYCGYEESESHKKCPKCGANMQPIVKVQKHPDQEKTGELNES